MARLWASAGSERKARRAGRLRYQGTAGRSQKVQKIRSALSFASARALGYKDVGAKWVSLKFDLA